MLKIVRGEITEPMNEAKLSKEAGGKQEKQEKSSAVGTGLVMGMCLGLVFGSAIGNTGAGLAMGISFGICFGAAIDARTREKA